MKKGLVTVSQIAYSKVIWPLQEVLGSPLGSYVTLVVAPEDECPVGEGYFWIDVPDDAVAYTLYYDEGTASAVAIETATYYATSEIPGYAGFSQPVYVVPSTDPEPDETTALVPPSLQQGQTLYWYGSTWVASSFDPTLSLNAAKQTLISMTEVNASSAAEIQGSKHSTVQKITVPDVNSLETLSYPGTSLGEYQSYLDGLVASSIATINAATTNEDLYGFNPDSLPYEPSASGVLFTGRGSGLGPQDLNVSYYNEFNSVSLTEADTELYVPGTSTVISYVVDPETGEGTFDSAGNCFNPGDYRIQIRQVSNSFVIAEFEVPLNPAGENVAF